MPEPAAVLGPVEYIVIRFDGDRFTGDIVPALNDLLDQGLVRLIDIAVVSKAADGAVSILETQELGPEVAAAFLKLTGEVSGLLSEADLAGARRGARPRHHRRGAALRARLGHPLRQAVRAAQGELVLSERIPHAVMTEAQASLLAVAG